MFEIFELVFFEPTVWGLHMVLPCVVALIITYLFKKNKKSRCIHWNA